MTARETVALYYDAWAAQGQALPRVQLCDAHTHLGGSDPNGWRCPPGELPNALAIIGRRASRSR